MDKRTNRLIPVPIFTIPQSTDKQTFDRNFGMGHTDKQIHRQTLELFIIDA